MKIGTDKLNEAFLRVQSIGRPPPTYSQGS